MLEKMQPPIVRTSTPTLVRRALSAHSVMGIALSAVLYIICLSGTVSVFKEDIHKLEQRGEPRVEYLSPESAQRAAEAGFNEEPSSAHLYIQMPSGGHSRALVQTDNQERYVDESGALSGSIAHPWSAFLIDLHYY